MFWTVEKLQARIRELDAFRYRDVTRFTSMRMKADNSDEIGAYPKEEGMWEDVSIGHRWQGRDAYHWLAVDAHVPAAWSGRPVVGLFDFGKTSGSGGFESLLFVNGQPYQGVDSNHMEVFMPAEAAGCMLQLRFRLWSGLGGYQSRAVLEHRLSQAALAWIDEPTDDLFYTSRAALDIAVELPENRPERYELLSTLDRAYRAIEWSRPGSGDFYASVQDARDRLREALAVMPKSEVVTVRCVGHTHIDIAWLWRLRHTREKAARSFSTVLRLMERFPEYVFLQTQPQLYEYLKQDYPELYGQIKDKVAEGRWEAGGGMWLEADCNLTSGESLVRQLLYGIRFFKKEFGVDCDYLWLPDVFGYSWALPQILLKTGIKAFMTTKISWNQYNRMPHDTFRWRGIDGSEILTHFITTPDPGATGQGIGAFYYTYNGAVTAKTVLGIWDAYRDKELNRELLLSYGYGDGGGGVNREMLELRRRLSELPGAPQVTTGRADTYFRQLRERVEASEAYVHTWDGELYLELHRGTYTSQAYNKRMNRKLEVLYREAEWISVVSVLFHRDWNRYRQEALNEGWKIILRNQFHDIIPGSSIREVYEDCRKEYAEAEWIGTTAWRLALEAIQSLSLIDDIKGSELKENRRAWTVFNGAPWTRSDLVRIPAEANMKEGIWCDGEAIPLEAQQSGTDWLIRVKDIPPMGWTTIYFEVAEKDEKATPFKMLENGIETPHYTIEWNEHGQLIRIRDKMAERDVLPERSVANVLQVFEDKPKSRHEAWDIDLYYLEKVRTIDDLRSARVVETGQLRTVVEFEWSYMDSRVRQRMITYTDSRRIDFETYVDWHEQRQLLKVAFPVDIRSTEATYDIQFGNVKRPTHWNTSWDFARFETVGHQWADLSEDGYGVSLLNDCKYGYDIKDNVLRLSLIKSARVPDDCADQGEHRFTYALLPHVGNWREGCTVREAWALNSPLSAVAGKAQLPIFSLLRTMASDHIFIDAVKKAEDEDAVIVRLHEYNGARGEVVLESDLPINSWMETDLLERPLNQTVREKTVRFSIKPYEVKTFQINFGL